MADRPTADPFVVIEAQGPGYVRYRCTTDGRRWEVTGVCDRRGNCLVGAVINGVQVRDLAHLAEMVASLGKNRIDSDFDVPVTPAFEGCCPLIGRWL